MDQIETYLKPYVEYLKNPYVIGLIGIIGLVYGPLLAPKLPSPYAQWFDNPVFKVAFLIIVLIVSKISPTMAIILTLCLIISLQTLSRYRIFTMANEVSQITANHPKPDPTPKDDPSPSVTPKDESNQFNQELGEQLQEDKNQADAKTKQQPTTQPTWLNTIKHAIMPTNHQVQQEDANNSPIRALHPFNRPTENTTALKKRVENPDDPSHPGWQLYGISNLNTALYELNPPFAGQQLPTQSIANPQKLASRYSAYHGYNQPSMIGQPLAPIPESPKHVDLNPDINNNMMTPMDTSDSLPRQFTIDPVQPPVVNNQNEVGAQMMTTDHIGPQGYGFQSGYLHSTTNVSNY